MSDYKFVDHTYDVVVVGAGGSGLRAALGAAQGVSVDARIATSPPDPEGAGEALVRVLPGGEPRVDSIDVWGRRLYGVRDDG